jgi:hypothetical protein
MESRPFVERVPDQSLIAGDTGAGADHVRATRGERYAFVYIPTGKPLEIKMGVLPGESVRAAWFDPRTGETKPIGSYPNTGTRRFEPPGKPGRGNDWVLEIDSQARPN